MCYIPNPEGLLPSTDLPVSGFISHLVSYSLRCFVHEVMKPLNILVLGRYLKFVKPFWWGCVVRCLERKSVQFEFLTKQFFVERSQ